MPSPSNGPTRWQKFRLIVKVVELRLRFVALMAATGLVFAYWDELVNRYEKWSRPAGGSSVQAGVAGVEFYCPMHPQVVQDEHGSCPICGMPLARRKKGEKTGPAEGAAARVELSPYRVRQAGIRTVAASFAPLDRTLSTVGYVAFDERRMANIVAKAPGKTRVEKLHVNYTGQDVEVGQTLAELYSPELSQAVEELLNAARRAGQGARVRTEVARSLLADREAMVGASIEKLRRWGIAPKQIDEILKRGKADVTIPVLSPIRGHVLKKNVVEGQEVREGDALFEVADLRTVWIQAQVYEHQLGSVREGQAVEARVEAFPGETFAGKVEFLQPHLDPATRTVDVRFALENPGLRLRPGMFASVTLREPMKGPGPSDQKTCPVTRLKLGAMGDPVAVEIRGRKILTCCASCPPKLKARPDRYLIEPSGDEILSVPESAVIDTGDRKVVYVEVEPGVFEGREVILGRRSGDRFPVLEGLAPGENVAAAGAFLIDAESRLNLGTMRVDEAPKRSASTAGEDVQRH